MNEYMSKQDVVNLVYPEFEVEFADPIEVDCYYLIAGIAERLARFADYNTPMTKFLQLYGCSISMNAGVASVQFYDHSKEEGQGFTICLIRASMDSAEQLNEMLAMIDYIREELTV